MTCPSEKNTRFSRQLKYADLSAACRRKTAKAQRRIFVFLPDRELNIGQTCQRCFLAAVELKFDENRVGEISPSGLRYSLEGAAGGKLIVVLGGISACCEVSKKENGSEGWWGRLIGPGKPVDTNEYCVLSFDYLASPLLSVNDPGYVSTQEQAEALSRLLGELGLTKISTFIGASYGGMVGLSFATLYPEKIDKLVVISAAHRPSPFSMALRTIQRKIVQLSNSGETQEGLSLARSLAMLTYRTADEINERFSEAADSENPESSSVWSYLTYQGDKYARVTDPFRFLSLSRSIDGHSIEPSRVTTPLTVVACNQDQLVPVDLCRELVNGTSGPAQLICFDSIYGHDAFLKEEQTQMAKIVSEIMEVR